MAKKCNVCNTSYSDDLAVCPNCASAIEIVLGDPPKAPSKGAKPPADKPETSSDSEFEIDLGQLPKTDEPASAISNVKWSALVEGAADSDVGLTVDSPSDVALLGKKGQTAKPPDKGVQPGSWADIGLDVPDREGSSVVVQAGGGGSPGATKDRPGSGSDDEIDLTKLDAESRAKDRGQESEASGILLEGDSPRPGAKRPASETASGSDIDLGELAAKSATASPSPLPERLLRDDGSEIDLGRPKKKKGSGSSGSGLDLVSDALDSGVDLAARADGPGAEGSGVDLAALFEDASDPGRKIPRAAPTDASTVDLGSLPKPNDPAARAGRTPTSSDVRLVGGSDVQLAGSSGRLGKSDVELAGSDVRLAGSDVGMVGDSGLGLAELEEPTPRRITVPAAPAPSKAGAWVGGGILGALLGTAACAGVWFSGLLPGTADTGKAAVRTGGEAEVKTLQDEVARLKAAESEARTESRDKGVLLARVEAEAKEAQGKSEVAIKETLAKAEETRKLLQTQTEEAVKREEEARKQATALKDALEVAKKSADPKALDEARKEVVALKGALDEAKKAADPKALELLKTERADALKQADEARKQSVALKDALEEAKKAADPKAMDLLKKERADALAQATALKNALEEAKKAADPKVLELIKQERADAVAQVTALKDALEAAKKAADPKALEQLKKEHEAAMVKVADLEKSGKADKQKVADLEKDWKAAEQKIADLGLALKQAKGGGGEAMQKVLEAARTEAADAKKRLDDASQKLTASEKNAQVAKEEADKAKKDAAEAQKTATLAATTVKTLEQKLKDSDTRVLTAEAKLKEAADRVKEATAQATVAAASRAQADAALQAATKQLADAKENIRQLLAKGPASSRTDIPAAAVDPLAAEEQFTSGLRAFHGGDPAQAEQTLVEAARYGGLDARYVYFLGLARLAQGKTDLAEADFRDAARLERLNKPSRAVVNTALERIQGPARQTLERFRQ